MPDRLPTNAQRLFAHYPDAERLPTDSPEFVIARLLEDGDGSDLRWLTSIFSETELSSWLNRHGSRLLTRRSLGFWRAVFDRPAPEISRPGEQLWPF